MMLLTCIAILAVDFSIFPRRFAKVETFGVSLMDLGVGMVVFSMGIVSVKSFLPRADGLSMPALSTRMRRALSDTLPLLVLGFARLIAVKGTAYQVSDRYYVSSRHD
jgi:phosphatidylinositol glycan class W